MEIETYQYRENYFSGDKKHPHLITLFAKSSDNKLLGFNLIPKSTFWGMIPLFSYQVAVHRAAKSFKVLYKEGRQVKALKSCDPHLQKCFKAAKNLLRASLESVPLIGNLSLALFESVRLMLYSNRLSRSLKDEKDAFGLAVDGKILFHVSREQFDLFLKKSKWAQLDDETRLIWFKLAIDQLLKKAEGDEKFKKSALTDLLREGLENTLENQEEKRNLKS